jgi:hypothetical protein
MSDEGIYKDMDIIKGKVSLKVAPPVILIKSGNLVRLMQALNIAVGEGYKIKAAFERERVRVMLEREDYY